MVVIKRLESVALEMNLGESYHKCLSLLSTFMNKGTHSGFEIQILPQMSKTVASEPNHPKN